MCDGEMGEEEVPKCGERQSCEFSQGQIYIYTHLLLFINSSITLPCKFYKYSVCVCVCVLGMAEGRMGEHQMNFYQRGII